MSTQSADGRRSAAKRPLLRALIAVAALFGSGCGREPVIPPVAVPAGTLERGRLFTEWLHTGQADQLWSRFSPELRDVFGGVSGLRRFISEVQSGGTERHVLEERVIAWIGSEIYHRSAQLTGVPEPVWVQWTIHPTGTILGLVARPAEAPSPSGFLEYQTRTELALPFTGEWFVFWGGRSVVENYHAKAADQRFAYDLLVVRDGQTFTGDPTRNESYFCFGQPILAPGPGIVRAAVDGVADNRPGRMNATRPLGNYVVLDHGQDEFSFLVHLQHGSIVVEEGQAVETGALLGRCGNSGRSSEAHLHYHLQNTAKFEGGEGLPPQFHDYLADGQEVPRGEPVRGHRVQSR